MERSKLSKGVETGWLFWGFMMPGIGDAVLGPTLLDVQLLINKTVDMFSYVTLSSGIGAVAGSILAGVIFPGINRNLKLAIVLFLGSLTNTITAAVPSYAYFLVMFAVQGVCRGFIACYLLEVCNTLWEHKGAAFQFVFCGATTGSILTPLIVKPFLCVNNTVGRHAYGWSIVTESPVNGHPYSFSPGTAANGTGESGGCQASDTRVQYAYVVLGLLTMPSAVAFLYYWITTRNTTIDSENRSQYENLDRNVTSVKTKLQFAHLVVLFFFYCPVLGNIILYNTYLTAFGVDGPLHMSKSSMVYMTSVFFGGFLLSRVGNALLTLRCGNLRIILVNVSCLFVSGVVLICLADKYEAALWVCTVAIGLFSGPYQGAVLAWTENFMKIDAKVISVTVLGVGTGVMVSPFIGGLLYHYAPPMGHLYLLFSMIVLMCVLFLLLNVIGKQIKKQSASSGDEITLEEPDSGDS